VQAGWIHKGPRVHQRNASYPKEQVEKSPQYADGISFIAPVSRSTA